MTTEQETLRALADTWAQMLAHAVVVFCHGNTIEGRNGNKSFTLTPVQVQEMAQRHTALLSTIAAQQATIAALEQERNEARAAIQAMADGDEGTVQDIIAMAVRLADDPNARRLLRHVAAQSERITEARAEVERLDALRGAAGNMLHYIAFVTTGDSSGDPQLGADRLKTRAEQAEAAAAHWQAEHGRVVEALEKRVLKRLIRPGGGWVCDLCDEWTISGDGRIEHKEGCLLSLAPTPAEPHTPAPADREER